MSNHDISFEIDPSAAGQVEALRAELSKALPGFELSVQQSVVSDDRSRAITPETVAWIAVLVGLPGALNSTLSLAERLKLTSGIEGLIGWAGRQWKEKGLRIRWGARGGLKKPLDQAKVDEIVEALEHLRAGEQTD